MKRSRIEHVKKYSMIALLKDLGFTPIYESQTYYTTKEHDSLKIKVSKNRFYWYSKSIGGDTITLCQTLGLERDPSFHSFIYTVLYLEKRMFENPQTVEYCGSIHKGKLILPERNKTNKEIYYYLYDRGICYDIIQYFIDHHYLYQSSYHHNLVFVSYKKQKPVFISEKGSSKKDRFMREYPENDYRHCFYICHQSSMMIVTESIIDMMSLMSLEKNFKNYDYLSLNSVSHYSSVFYHLENHPAIQKILLRLDNDAAGKRTVNLIASRIKKHYPSIRIDIAYPYMNKDWNDYLVKGIGSKEEIIF